jgi:hypothetical protein
VHRQAPQETGSRVAVVIIHVHDALPATLTNHE